MVTSTGSAPEKKIPSAFIYFFGSFGGILFGYDIGVMTGALELAGQCQHHRLDYIGSYVWCNFWRCNGRTAFGPSRPP